MNIDDCVQLLHEGSLGCIGLLRAWLLTACALAGLEGGVINRGILHQARRPDSDLEEILAEIDLGERLLEISATSAVAARPAPARQKTKGNKPFQRKPKRYGLGNRTKVK